MSPGFEPLDAAIVGAGISGLTCALALRRAGLRVAVLEASDDVGGCIKSSARDGCVADGGPQTFVATPDFLDLIETLECHAALQRAPGKSPAMFLYSRRRLQPTPTSPSKFLATALLSPFDKARILFEPLVGASFGPDDESIAHFAARRGGHGVVEALVRPLVSGIFAGDPAKLSIRSAFPALVGYERRYSSVIVGALARQLGGARRPAVCGFRGGNAALTSSMADTLGFDVRVASPVVALTLRGANIELAYEGPRPGSVVARRAILALPAYASGALLAQLEPEAADALVSIEYVPLMQVALTYPRNALSAGSLALFDHSAKRVAFGFLSGKDSGLKILGCAFNSATFPDRCPPDRVLITAFLGGAADFDILKLSDEEAVRIVHHDLQRVLRLSECAPAVIAGFRFDRAIPQYALGHAEKLRRIAESLERLPHVELCGNYFSGPSVQDCIAGANAVASRVAAALAPKSA
jgi:protoporphyrinogen/coproporphyrinogen III oxidase